MHVRSLARDLLGLIVSGLSFPGVASAADGHVVMSKARQVRVSPAGEPAGAVVARGERETGFQPVSERLPEFDCANCRRIAMCVSGRSQRGLHDCRYRIYRGAN